MKIKLESGNAYLNVVPNECPNCHRTIHPYYVEYRTSANHVEVVFQCPSYDCGKLFIGTYYDNGFENFIFVKTNIGTFKSTEFSPEIKKISPSFVNIYNESSFAEQNELFQICGVSYRKALEFLIKDYLIYKRPDNEERVKEKFLGNCIKDDVTDSNLKTVAERAAWLGNDEAHYVRLWQDKDLEDLKSLIKLAVYWIDGEILTEAYKKSMPKR
jgi:hypothetical protein